MVAHGARGHDLPAMRLLPRALRLSHDSRRVGLWIIKDLAVEPLLPWIASISSRGGHISRTRVRPPMRTRSHPKQDADRAFEAAALLRGACVAGLFERFRDASLREASHLHLPPQGTGRNQRACREHAQPDGRGGLRPARTSASARRFALGQIPPMIATDWKSRLQGRLDPHEVCPAH